MADEDNAQPYRGEEKIIVAIDLGTTQSAVSFSHFYPGHKIEVRMVTKWRGQPEARGDSKIPTIVAYQDGDAVSFGAEAREYIGDPAFEIAQWFKLYLHPDNEQTSGGKGFEIPPLPCQVSLRTVYADFMRYLFESTQKFFEENTPNGVGIWSRLRDGIVVVLATPNGWDTIQHSFLRAAAIQAELVKENNADLQLEFVTESEASVHFALARTQSRTWLKPGSLFVVTDAGGSTVDSVLYKCTATTPKLVLEEVRASECVQAGGVFVDRAAESMLMKKLKSSRFGDKQSIGDMIETFEKKTKRVFDGSQESNVVGFGGRRDNDRAHGILQGKITLTKNEVGGTFDEVVRKILDSCLVLLRGRRIQHLLLVGGFGESLFLRQRLNNAFRTQGTQVVTIDEPAKKAAAEGSALWFTKQLVVARAARYTVGTECRVFFNASDPEHLQRRNKVVVAPDGLLKLTGHFDVAITKNLVMEQNHEVSRPFFRQYLSKPNDLGDFTCGLMAWEGDKDIAWTTDQDGYGLFQLRHLCTLKADLSRLTRSLTMQKGQKGVKYWQVDFNIVISFGGTKLRARIQWQEEGKTCEGPVTILVGSVV